MILNPKDETKKLEENAKPHRRKVGVHNSNYFTDTLKILLQYKILCSCITRPIVYGLLQWIQRCIT